MPQLSNDQLDQIQSKVKALVEASANSTVKSQESRAAEEAAGRASMDAAKAKLDASEASMVASHLLNDLRNYVDGLAMVPPSQQ